MPRDQQAGGDLTAAERQRSIDKNVKGAMMLAFYAYLNRDRESLDIANLVMRECGYPRLEPLR